MLVPGSCVLGERRHYRGQPGVSSGPLQVQHELLVLRGCQCKLRGTAADPGRFRGHGSHHGSFNPGRVIAPWRSQYLAQFW